MKVKKEERTDFSLAFPKEIRTSHTCTRVSRESVKQNRLFWVRFCQLIALLSNPPPHLFHRQRIFPKDFHQRNSRTAVISTYLKLSWAEVEIFVSKKVIKLKF